MLNHRLIAHYALPRSGSTDVEVALRDYFARHGGYRALSEYFNASLPVSVVDGEPVVQLNHWERHQLEKEQLRAVKDQRIEWLQRSRGRYYFKALGHQLTHEGFHTVFKDCDVILSYRSDEWAQLLSFIISFQAGRDGTGARVVAEKKSFAHFISERRMYHRIKLSYAPKLEICFERFLSDGGRYMSELGLDQPFDWEKVLPPPRQSRGPKEELIANVDEVRQWFRDAGLELERR